MYRSAQFAGYLALLLTAGTLLVGAVLAPTEMPIGTTGIQLGILLTAAVAGVIEHRRELEAFETPAFDRSDAAAGLAVVVGAVVTYALSVYAGIGPVLASALVGLAAGLAVPRVGAPVYCGSFVGMASPAVFGSLESVALAGVVAGLGFVATTESFGGVGGKLGTLAMFGCLATAALLGLDFAEAGAPQWEFAHLIVPVAVAGAVATVVLSVRLEWGAVVGSGAVGVAAGVAFPLAVPEFGSTLAAVAFCASFVGMSSADRLGGALAVGVAGGLSGVVFLLVAPAFEGSGGKLGTIAFVSCIGLLGALELREIVTERLR
ncbi:hypothetical protein [Natronorubrum tibetense]|uniref:Uncharacterized protein n=1 Tax=Natronorubrum tibetense GA33 TaxID=1114856 RepID=L9VV12_9EURY|nr:hypothetical protein [Natronorubrum tibetense]ELY41009.1 hypothetical protein C496_09956 [Natronorubrum tibetense GA33]